VSLPRHGQGFLAFTSIDALRYKLPVLFGSVPAIVQARETLEEDIFFGGDGKLNYTLSWKISAPT
jgi:hypothetical protein